MPRRHDIDALRVIAFALLILYHVAMVYVADWGFHLKSSYQTEWLQWPMIALNRWRMPLLFMISGVAIGLFQPERAPLRFALQRSWRLLLPLVFGMFVVVAVQAYCEGVTRGLVAPGFGSFMLRYWQVRPWPAGSFSGADFGITWNHLWYLAYLLPYTLLLVALLPLLRSRALRHAARWTTGLPAWVWIAIPPLPLLACLLWLAPRFPETHALIDDWTVHAESFPLFLAGYAMARSQIVWQRLKQLRWTTLGIALLAIGVELSLRAAGRVLPTQDIPALLLQLPWGTIERAARALYTWTALLALFGWAQVLLDRPFRWLPYCSEAVFSWYILHQTLIILLVFWLAPLRLGPAIEPVLVLGGTVAGCLLLHELLIRRIAILRPLFGLKKRSRGETPNRIDATPTAATDAELATMPAAR